MAESAFHVRSEWGGTPPSGGALRGKKKYVVVHHTAADGEPAGFDPGRVKALERGEQNRGYSSLAYHFLVPKGGLHIVESRGWGNRGAATGGTAPNGLAWNDTSYAIVLDAYCHPPPNDQPTPAAIESIADAIVLGVFLGYIDPTFEVWRHRDASAGTKYATVCPGDTFGPVRGFGSVEALARWKIERAGSGEITPTPITPPPAAPSPPRCVAVASRRTLRRGSSGPSVKTLQNLLRSRGFDPGPSDGQFGKRTDAAVRCFQTAAGLTVDGVVGPGTWSALGA